MARVSRKDLNMKIIAFDNFKAGVTLDDLRPHLRNEVSNVWRLWKAGIVRENYARADVPGVVIVFECASVDEARRYVEDFPLSRAGFLDWQFIALDAPLPLEFLFDAKVDIAEPYDRTTTKPDHQASRLSRFAVYKSLARYRNSYPPTIQR